MAKMKKKKKPKKGIHPDFRRRLRVYTDLIDLIEIDYTDRRYLPTIPESHEPLISQADLFSWGNAERAKKYLKNIERRLNTLKDLRSEIYSILEASEDIGIVAFTDEYHQIDWAKGP